MVLQVIHDLGQTDFPHLDKAHKHTLAVTFTYCWLMTRRSAWNVQFKGESDPVLRLFKLLCLENAYSKDVQRDSTQPHHSEFRAQS